MTPVSSTPLLDAPATPPELRRSAPRGRERVLLLASNGSYRTVPFIEAAQRLGFELLVASEGRHSIVSALAEGLHLDLSDPEASCARVLREARAAAFAGVIATDDAVTELAARTAQALGLPHNPPAAVRIARRKDLARERLAGAGLRVPSHRRIDLRRPLAEQTQGLRYPCVVKPLSLSASRGVIRADTRDELLRACARVARLLQKEDVAERDHVLVEDFIPGSEVAVEGMLSAGALELLAIFDKPDPLDGPYFEESYYITPSRLDAATQGRIRDCVAQACRAYGLREGPIHAECRLNAEGVWVLEIAARTIGGLCARLFSIAAGCSLEERVLAHCTGRSPPQPGRSEAAGVLMIPVPQAGILRRVEGVLAAQRVPYIEEVTIQLRAGYELVPWPEGSSYLGFIFARAPTPAAAEAALREAHGRLHIVVAPLWRLAEAGAA